MGTAGRWHCKLQGNRQLVDSEREAANAADAANNLALMAGLMPTA
jgi:hypothetical protein